MVARPHPADRTADNQTKQGSREYGQGRTPKKNEIGQFEALVQATIRQPMAALCSSAGHVPRRTLTFGRPTGLHRTLLSALSARLWRRLDRILWLFVLSLSYRHVRLFQSPRRKRSRRRTGSARPEPSCPLHPGSSRPVEQGDEHRHSMALRPMAAGKVPRPGLLQGAGAPSRRGDGRPQNLAPAIVPRSPAWRSIRG